jgi:hypothetical protein
VKIDVTAGMKAHRTVGAISLDVITGKLEVDLDPDLTPLSKAITAALRARVRRIAATSERTGKKLFNQAGRFVNTIFARMDGPGQWSIRAILNRKAPGRVRQVYDRMVQLVPELKQPGLLAHDAGVQRAVEQILAKMVTVTRGSA